LRPVRWTDALLPPEEPKESRMRPGVRTGLQIATTYLIGLVLPFFAYLLFDRAGLDITKAVYPLVVVSLLITGGAVWLEGFLALEKIDPPPPTDGAPNEMPATAIIAAYLPNEAATVVETVEAMLQIDYPAGLKVILAYNTPRPLPIEDTLREIAARDSRFVPFKVEGSTSKAQNVNAALALATGVFVGIFDADHKPRSDSFRRAYAWLAAGYDVVQGHAVVRNGGAGWVSRTVAVEFESIYAVSHPGRNRLHHFGIFGGSNGYWRRPLLNQIRMRGAMLTEDIDSSLRVVEGGGRIANDPFLISTELAPATLGALWNQRLRWAQGWFQVSLRHLLPAMRNRSLTRRQKLGMAFLLGWREIYPWISLQMFPLIMYWVYRDGTVHRLNWLIPIFVLTSLFTASVGPGQVFFAYRLADPSVRQHRRWFWMYLLVAGLFYTEWKNLIARVAQLKELLGERAWKVTPRNIALTPDAADPPVDAVQRSGTSA
ncbi:MAG: glycosyltransferase family 2 protein, partial [Acidimicrobiales bacterium]